MDMGARRGGPRVRLGEGAVVIASDWGPVILSGGAPLQLRIRQSGDTATIRLVNDEHGLHDVGPVIAEGRLGEITREWIAITDELMPRSRPRAGAAIRVFAGAAAGAFLAVFAATWTYHHNHSAVPAALPMQASLPQLPTAANNILQIPGLLPALEEAARRSEQPPATDMAGPDIQKRPDFLVDPQVTAPGVPAAAAAAKPDTAAPADGMDLTSIGLPRYEAPGKVESLPEPSSDKAPAGPVGDRSVPGVEAPVTPEAEANAADAAPEIAEPAETTEEAADASKPEEGMTREEVALSAKTVADNMVKSGMTQEQAVDVVRKLEAITNGEELVTPELLATLPHEVAKLIIDSGLAPQNGALPDAPGGVPYSIIRLPEEIMEKYRGTDGIASIPERNSWMATGNSVNIPLPGGGDILKPDDLINEFGLKP